MADSDLIIQIDGDTKEFEKALRGLESTAKTALKGLTAGFAAVSAGIAGAVSVGASFEQQMKNVQAISGATGAEFEALTAKAREMGIETSFSATEAGKAFEYMAMAGWDTQAMLDGISGIMDLAAASGEELGLVSDIVTDALTAFGLQAKDSAHFADVLAMASSKSNTNIQQMGYAFKYVAPIAGAFKFSVEDVGVALGLMANAGIKSETAGTSLRALFTRLVKPPKDAAAAIQQLNLAVTNADGTMRPLNDIIIDLRKGFAGLSDAEKASVASSLAGQEAMSGLLAIVNAGEEDFQKLTQAINNASGEAKRMADIKLDTLSGAWSNLKSTIEETGLIIYDNLKEPFKQGVKEAQSSLSQLNAVLGTELEPELKKVGQGFSSIFEKLGEVAKVAIPVLVEGLTLVLDNLTLIGNAFVGFAGAVIAFKGVTVILGLAKALEVAKIAMVNLNIAFAKNPIGFLVTALSTLAGGIYALWETSESFRLGFIQVWYDIKYYVLSNIKVLADGIDKLIEGLNLLGADIPKINMAEPADPNKAFYEYRKKLQKEKDATLQQYDKLQKEFEEKQKEAEKSLTGTGEISYKSDKPVLMPEVEVGETKAKKKEKTKKNVFTDEFWADIRKEAFEFETKAETELSPVAERVGQNFASSVRQAIQGEYETTEDAIRGIGANLIYSLADEMLANTTNYLANALSQIGTFVISSMKGFFGIASPSKVFKSIGYDNMRGLALGFSENQDIVDNATSGVADKVKSGLENINPTLTPSFNLQNIKDMFNINAVTQPQLAGAVAGGNMIININSTFNMTGGGGTGQGQGVTADDLSAFSKDIETKIKGIVNKEIINNMRAGGRLSR